MDLTGLKSTNWWCQECGKDTPEGVDYCDVCLEWWKNNYPPG